MRFIGWQTEAELFKHPMVYYKTTAGRLFFLKCCKFVSRKMCVFFLFHPWQHGKEVSLVLSAGTHLSGSSGTCAKVQAELSQKALKAGLFFPFVLC